jgi:hypothetical protein
MIKNLFLRFGVFLIIFYSNTAFANVSINEVMYNAEGADVDWIEVYNEGNSSVDLSNLCLLVSNSTSNHSINNNSGSQELESHEYGIIVVNSQLDSFVSKWGSSGKIFTSSFSLPNVTDEESVKIEINDGDKLSPMTSVSYNLSLGSNGDGNSLQFINGSLKSGVPTPWLGNNILPNVDNSTTVATSSSSISKENEIKIKLNEAPSIKTKIIAKDISFVGLPTIFQASTIGYSDEVLRYGKYHWNFGDGDFKEQVNILDKFSHTYLYPGEYTVYLEYYLNGYLDIPDSKNKFIISVVPVELIISRVGDEDDFFIEIANNSDHEVDISNWSLSSGEKKFIFPKNSILSSKRKIILSPKLTNFNIIDKDNLKILTNSGNIIFSFINPNIEEKSKTLKSFTPEFKNNQNKTKELKKEEVIILGLNENLEANVSSGDTNIKNNSYLFFIVFVILLVVSCVAVYFIRRKKVISKEGDDFEILDE